MSQEHIQSFCRRAEEERRLAAAARDPRARKAHSELAEKYEAVALAYGRIAATGPAIS